MKNSTQINPMEANMHSLVMNIDHKLSELSGMKIKNDEAVRDLLGVAPLSETADVTVQTWNGTALQTEEVRQYRTLLSELNLLMDSFGDQRGKVFKASAMKTYGEDLIAKLKEKIVTRLKNINLNSSLGLPGNDFDIE